MVAKDPTTLYIRYVQAQMLKHNNKSYTLPKKYVEEGRVLDDQHEKHLQSVIDAQISRILEESNDKILDASEISKEPENLKGNLQLLVDGFQYRAQEKGDEAHRALESGTSY